jgi:hypothetical protein
MALKYIYSLTSLVFRVTEYEHGSWRFDTLAFAYKDVRCTLRQADGYKEIIEELKETHGGGAVTATLVLKSEEARTQDEMDELADSICELLAFAIKDEVFWIGRTVVGESDAELSRYRRSLGGRVRDCSFRLGDH